jgi:hypothetical protein
MCNKTVFMRAAAVLLASVPAVAGAQYDLSWFTIDGGGEMWSVGGVYSLGGTIGQPDTGVLAGGEFTLVGGFWAAAAMPCTLPGDLDTDSDVDQADLGILLSAYGTCPGEPFYSAPAGELAGDPCVTQTDLGVLLANYGQSCD